MNQCVFLQNNCYILHIKKMSDIDDFDKYLVSNSCDGLGLIYNLSFS